MKTALLGTALSLFVALTVSACSSVDEEEIARSSEAVSCGATVDVYLVRGPHNNGYDQAASSFACGSVRSNTDFYRGAGDANHPDGHLGNDIFGPRGTPIVAARAGTVVDVSTDAIGGNNVTVRDGCGWSHYYAHMDSFAGGITTGKAVSAGTQLGTLGDTGQAKGTLPHLHYSIFPDSYSAGIDPHPLLVRVEGSSCGGNTDPVAVAPATRVTCGDVAKKEGFADHALCEWNGNKACRGTGRQTDDCDHCCDSRELPPATTTKTCGELAREYGFVYAKCEWNGNDACKGSGAKTADCDHCCDD